MCKTNLVIEVNDMHLRLPHCIERLAKAGRVITIEYSKSGIRITYNAMTKNIIPFGQTRLTEYSDSNGQNSSKLPYVA